ncbi:MAG TPA: lysylphosphatidylglycerol synthase domain-containing protein, partial [Verrucomicrobiae bacterium]|nr:lysylphosphatidylglycerol synthase domain-containing protein [Verrucomicrobiae bacterium]
MDLPPRKRLIPLLRVASAMVAVAALLYVFSRINLVQLAHALRSAQPGWLLATVAVYGLVFLPAAWRWHIVLRLGGCAVHP